MQAIRNIEFLLFNKFSVFLFQGLMQTKKLLEKRGPFLGAVVCSLGHTISEK